jgi:translation initiation factor eIF-2B subunit delta
MGATSVLSNGAMIAKCGSAMVACMAKKLQKPVVVFSETYKFSDKMNLDSINRNEIGNPKALAESPLMSSAQ